MSSKSISVASAARRKNIMESAIAVIADQGITQASFDAIGEHAGISKGVISYHFKHRQDLMESIIETIYEEAAACIRPQVEAAPNYMSAMRVYIEACITFVSQRPTAMAALIEILRNSRPQECNIDCMSLGVQEKDLLPLEYIFTEGQKTAEFRSFSPRIMAITLRQAVDSIVPQLQANSSLDVAAYTAELVVLFTNATKNQP